MSCAARRRSLVPVAAGIAGVVGAHTLAYLSAYPDGAERAHVLQHTGHSYWPLAVMVGVIAGFAALAASVRRGVMLAAIGRVASTEVEPVARIGRLALWQMALYAAMESVERIGAGISPFALVHSHDFAVGLALQVVVAAGFVVLLRLIEQVSARVALAMQRPRVSRQSNVRAWWLDAVVPALAFTRPGQPRAPPTLAVS